MKEEWKPVDGYFGHYEVSNLGRVKALTRLIPRRDGFGRRHFITRREKILTPKKRGAYHSVALHLDGEKRNHSIHRLVAIAFLGYPDHPEMQVNHIDEDKHNNSADNLEWSTRSYNQSHTSSKWKYLLTKGDKTLEVVNVTSFCKSSDFYPSAFWRVRAGKQKTIKGWEVSYSMLN